MRWICQVGENDIRGWSFNVAMASTESTATILSYQDHHLTQSMGELCQLNLRLQSRMWSLLSCERLS